jgi:hypothetical protein
MRWCIEGSFWLLAVGYWLLAPLARLRRYVGGIRGSMVCAAGASKKPIANSFRRSAQ